MVHEAPSNRHIRHSSLVRQRAGAPPANPPVSGCVDHEEPDSDSAGTAHRRPLRGLFLLYRRRARGSVRFVRPGRRETERAAPNRREVRRGWAGESVRGKRGVRSQESGVRSEDEIKVGPRRHRIVMPPTLWWSVFFPVSFPLTTSPPAGQAAASFPRAIRRSPAVLHRPDRQTAPFPPESPPARENSPADGGRVV